VFGGGHIWELAIIVILALIVFGPKRLPELGGALGKGIKEFKKGTQELQDSFSSDSSVVQSESSSQPRPVQASRVSADEPVTRSSAADREAS
jgi:sec-independent protein translocase protein TatA